MVSKWLLAITALLLSSSLVLGIDQVTVFLAPQTNGVRLPSTTMHYRFLLTSDEGCVNKISEQNFTVSTDNYGVATATINLSGLSNTPKFLCEYREGVRTAVHRLNENLFVNATYTENSSFLILRHNIFWLNESLLNKTIDERENDTTYSENSTYLKLGDTIFWVNESMLNKTIDARENDTVYTENSSYLRLENAVFWVNESRLNKTIDARENDTKYWENSTYFQLSNNFFWLNESRLNNTIDAREKDTKWARNDSDIINQSGVLAINHTTLNKNYYTRLKTRGQFVNRTDWTTHDNYPAPCSSGKAVISIGDSLTCDTFLQSEADGSTTNELQNLWETIVSDSGSTIANSLTDTLTISGSTDGIDTSIINDELTISFDGSELPNDDIQEAAISFTTVCDSNHKLYVSSGDLTCGTDNECSSDNSCSLITYDSETTNWDKDSSDDLLVGSNAGGDLTGTYPNPKVRNESHTLNILNITGKDSNICSGTDKVINVTFNDGDLLITCAPDETGSYDLNITSDSGSGTINDNEVFTIIGSGITTTSMSGNTLTINSVEADGSVTNELQNLWSTFTADSGSTTANTQTDSFSLNGGTDGIDTSIAGDALSITFDGSELPNDDIAESAISFATSCSSGNHLYISSGDLVCEPDDDNPEPSDVSWSDLTDQGTHVNGDWCSYSSTTGYIDCDVTPVTDTNAGTECSGTNTYLDGEGNCDVLSGVYVKTSGGSNMTGNLTFKKNKKLFFGDNAEAYIMYNGSSLIIKVT